MIGAEAIKSLPKRNDEKSSAPIAVKTETSTPTLNMILLVCSRFTNARSLFSTHCLERFGINNCTKVDLEACQ